MVLSCISSTQVLLQYIGLKGKSVVFFNTTEKNWNIDTFKKITSKIPVDPRKTLTWEFEEQIYWRRWLVEGTWKSASSSSCGESREWRHIILNPEPKVNFEVIENGAIGYRNPSYDFFKQGIPFIPILRANGYQMIKVSQCGLGGFNPKALDASLDSITPYPGGNGRWWINFYEDGEFHSRDSVWGKSFTPPHHLIDSVVAESEYQASKTFEKISNVEAVELREISGEENEWQVWKISLDESQQQIAEEPIFSFVGKEPELFCLDDGKCPQNTCEVECPTHYCCYNNKGISVFSYSK